MANIQATLSNQRIDPSLLTGSTIGILNIKSELQSSPLEKISLTISLDANWHMKYNNESFPLDKSTLQVGYNDSKGVMSYRNTGKVVGGAAAFMPLIWNESNNRQAFQLDFAKGSSDTISIRYQFLFKLSGELPKGFNDTFSGAENLTVGQPHEFALKVFLQ